MRVVLVLAALGAALLVAPALAQDAKAVYRWVDEDGVVHYTDQPRDGAEKVQVREPQSYSARESLQSTPTARAVVADAGTPAVTQYTSVRIVNPENDSVAWNTGGEISVSIATEPALDTAAGHRVMLYLDGQAVAGTPAPSTTVALSGIHRGTYEVYATVVDAEGVHLAQSDVVTFHVRQTSIQNPQRRR